VGKTKLVVKHGEERGLDREEILGKIQEITADRLGVDESDVTPDASFREDLEADSLDLVELIMELEEQFGMEIPDEEAEKITTVEEAVDYVQEHQTA
jgi:acyl carrier protein